MKFFKGKRILGYVSGTVVKSMSTADVFVAELDAWKSNNAKILDFTIMLSTQLAHSW